MQTSRRWLRRAAIVLAVAAVGFLASRLKYPSDRTPEGAYLRIVKAVNLGQPRDFFAYLETRAQHAAYTIRDFRKKARARILASYPEPERAKLASEYESEATAPDGADVFALYANKKGWMHLLRRDMSGISRVEMDGERATVETARGTRYSFRRRENGIWGLTLFTPALVAAAERAARDHAVIEEAAADYDRASKGAR